MSASTGKGSFSLAILALASVLFIGVSLGSSVGTAWGYTPESPEVKKVIEKAQAYLATAHHQELGGQCLMALALLKAGETTAHPKVVAAIESCRANLPHDGPPKPGMRPLSLPPAIYSPAIAAVFFV